MVHFTICELHFFFLKQTKKKNQNHQTQKYTKSRSSEGHTCASTRPESCPGPSGECPPLTLLSSAPAAAQGLCAPGFPHPHKAPQYAHTHPPFLSPFPSLPVAHVLPRRGPTTTCSELSFRGKLVTQDHCQNHAGHLMGQSSLCRLIQVPRSPSRTALLLQGSNHVNKERSEHTLAQAEDSLYFGLLGTTYPSGFQAELGCREVMPSHLGWA